MLGKSGCLCGAVPFKAKGELLDARICNYRSCQMAMGTFLRARNSRGIRFMVDSNTMSFPDAGQHARATHE
jgi:hypothetical protein